MTTAMRQARPGTELDAGRRAQRRATTTRGVARGLGWFSIALGLAQVAAPRAVERLIGVPDTGTRRKLVRLVGLRELAAGIGTLSRSKPSGWLWARAGGDAIDLALLGVALRAKGARKSRLAAAIAAVAGVMGPDVAEGTRLARGRAAPAPGDDTARVAQAITVNRPRDEVYAFWRDFENLPRFMDHLESVRVTDERRSHWKAKAPAARTVEWDAEIVEERPGELISWRSLPGADVESSGCVSFADAPRGRGTQIRVELRYSPPGRALAPTVAKLFGEEPETQTYDDLRRFKQVIETGEVVRSEGTPGGVGLVNQLKQRAAHPLGGAR